MEEKKTLKRFMAKVVCQVRHPRTGLVRTYQAGEMDMFEECPDKNWQEVSRIAASSIDFLRVPENVLRDNNLINLDDIAAFINDRYGMNYFGQERKQIVDALMQLRTMPPEDLSGTAPLAPTAAEFKNPQKSDNLLGIDFAAPEQKDEVEEPDVASEVIEEIAPFEETESDNAEDLTDLL